VSILNRLKLAKDVITKNLTPKNLEEAFKTVLSGGKPPDRSEFDLLKGYSKLPWLRAAINRISFSCASVEWRLYVSRDRKGYAWKNKKLQQANFSSRKKLITKAKRNNALEEIEEHPVYDLINGFNPMLNGLLARQLLFMYPDLTGDSFILKERNDSGQIVALWPVPSIWVTQTPSFSQNYFKVQVGNYYYDIPRSEIIWTKSIDPKEPYGKGSSTAGSLADELDTDEYAAKHMKQWFYNRARPDILVTPKEGSMSKEDTKRLEKEWAAKSGGFWNKFKPYFMARGVNVTELSQTFKNMELTELRKNERDIIRQVFGIPPEILGIVETSNRATIEAADMIMAKYVMIPRLELVRVAFQEELATEFDEKLIIDYIDPTPEDREFKKSIMNNHPYAFEIDEIRDVAGLDPLPDEKGKARPVPINLVFDNEKAVELEEDKKVKKFNKEFDDEIAKEVLNSLEDHHITYEVQDRYKAIVEQVGAITMSDLDIEMSFNLLSPRVVGYIETEVGDKIKRINATTKQQIRETLTEGVKRGEGISDLAERIEEVFEKARGNRSVVIARTETMDSVNFATLESYEQSGVVDKKEWVATPDDRTRDSHLDMDGQIKKIKEPDASKSKKYRDIYLLHQKIYKKNSSLFKEISKL